MVRSGSLFGLMILILVGGLLGGCVAEKGGSGTFDETVFNPAGEVKTMNFASEEEYTAFLEKHQLAGAYSIAYRDESGWGRPMMAFEQSVSVSAGADSDGGRAPAPSVVVEPVASGAKSFSETNVQVAGVDEADILKTDGEYIYTITDSVLYVIKAYPGVEAEVVSQVEFENGWPNGLFINGDHLAVFGYSYDDDVFARIGVSSWQGMSFFDVYDISDKANPKLMGEYEFEGSYVGARMVDDHVYFVVGTWPEIRPGWPTPIILEGGDVRSVPVSDIYYFDYPYRNPQLVTVHSINIADMTANIESKSVAVEGGQTLYMSGENIFLTYTEWVDENEFRNQIMKDMLEGRLSSADKDLIERIKATDDDVLSQYEKEAKIMQGYWSYLSGLSQDEAEQVWNDVEQRLEQKLKEIGYLEYTVINKIAVSDGSIEVKANGKVPGHIMNQFSLDEDTPSGVLRIATTLSGRWSSVTDEWTEQVNNVYALDADMKIIGRLEGLAETEQIYSTRFIGDKLYMVTFRQTDPFFVIDLSDPTNITELGQLKIPGFSRYLHPYDENTLIGIGQDANDEGRTQGLKISLFDVSDFANPKEIAKYVGEDEHAQSIAEYEHKAFLFDREKALLVIPVYSYGDWGWEREWGWDDDIEEKPSRPEESFAGAFVFKINKDEISLRGLIDHTDEDTAQWETYDAQVERSLYIQELLYTKSRYLLKINQIDDLTDVKEVELSQ